MESLKERLCLVRERIAHMEASYDIIRKIYKKMKPEGYQRVRDIKEQNGWFPPLPPRLPWPEYALGADPVDQDKDSLKFYLACEIGIMSDVVSFIGKKGHSPKQAVRQYGLEQASFGCKSEVARYLLENGTLLHNNCFIRSVKIKKAPSGETDKYVYLFDEADGGDNKGLLTSLLQAFINVGSWHPNQPWETYWKSPRIAICTPKAITDITLLKFLLAHGADPNVGSFGKTSSTSGVNFALDRQCPAVLNGIVEKFDPSLVDLLLRHGARRNCEGLYLLHLIVQRENRNNFAKLRRPLAQFLLDQGLADVNEAKKMLWRHEGTRYYIPGSYETETPLTLACAASDWEYVEWLLEHGADPDALDGKAYKELWWCNPYDGPNDPSRLAKLVRKVQEKRQG
ncbi:hypothetical protein DL766_007810 [Monosporascus sp. MC13-8B]|uniref:Clr5 domain-containing protein n=1 Tax=Monosporascus cannonballus TaxID=155416 RepID=A0ABY0H581_9PEZI|nr:hypothetical protein DL762_006399 [Monosporascus cannonballus]RYO86474.1 hypothetical protein DL763_006684 [Monosporascus cannonballus]RYP21984.1 hypothetical protein DL766_007810 [Monosporascus sp. MC13-8B]